MSLSPTDSHHSFALSSPLSPALPDLSPTLPRSPTDTTGSLASLMGSACIHALPLTAAVTSADSLPGSEESHAHSPFRPTTPCAECGERSLCQICGLCGRCGRESAPSPSLSPAPGPPAPSSRSSASSHSSSSLSIQDLVGHGSPQSLQVQLTGRDVPDAPSAGPRLGQQLVVLAFGTGLAQMPPERQEQAQTQGYVVGPVAPSGAAGELQPESSAPEMPSNAHYEADADTASFTFEIEDRSLAAGASIGYRLALWAQATLGGTWEHRVHVVLDNGSEGGSGSDR